MSDMRKLTTDPRRDDSRSDIFTRAQFVSATGDDITTSKTMKISGGGGLPAPPEKHRHHRKAGKRSHRAR